MKALLVNFLRCPESGSPVQLVDQACIEGGEIISGRLISLSGRAYPIVEGIPIMLLPEQWPPGQLETQQSFSEKWRRVPNYREATRGHYIQWYLDRYGFRTIDGLKEFLSPKTRILDAGTGHGRDAELYARNSSAMVFGVDISDGIYNAYRGLQSLDNLHLVQADLGRLPFPEEFFDFIACEQAIHHTPDTQQSFLGLLRHLAPGGHIAIYVYKKKGPVREFCDDYIRQFTARMPPEECIKLCEAITEFGKSLSELKIEIEVPQDIPILEIKAGTYDLQRFIYWHMFKCYWNGEMDWESNVITDFDWYHPVHAHRHTRDEVQQWFEEARVEIVHFNVIESGISVIGLKEE